MKITTKRRIKTKRRRKSKFLFLPLFHRGVMYWLERVEIVKNFNGRNYQITSINRLK